MKSWADHSSSEDEDESPRHRPQEPPRPVAVEEEDVVEDPQPPDEEEHEEDEEEPPRRKRKEHILPDGPPFTAFVGNLAFAIKDPNELAQKVADLVHQRVSPDIQIVVTNARVAMDRDSGKARGFGYIELETLEMLQAVLELDDGGSMIANRPINLDVAAPPNPGRRNRRNNSTNSSFSQPDSNIDGSQFRGGRYNRKGSFHRQNSEASAQEGQATQRPSLKLKPRSQGTSMGESEGSNSDIFGGGKAADHDAWEQRRQSMKKEDRERRQQQSAGRGDVAGRGGGRGGGSGRGNRNSNNRRQSSSKSGRGGTGSKKKEDAGPKAPAPAPSRAREPEKSKPTPAAVTNRFAGLGFDDSDSD